MCPSWACTPSSVSAEGVLGRGPHCPPQEFDLCPSPCLPSPGARFEDTELQRLKLVDSIKTYKSKAVSGDLGWDWDRIGIGSPRGSLGIMLLPWGQTIFEINATSRTLASTVMRSKRRHDHTLIEKFQRGQQEKRAAALKGQRLCPAPIEPQDGEGEQEDLQVTGSWMQELLELPWPGAGSIRAP